MTGKDRFAPGYAAWVASMPHSQHRYYVKGCPQCLERTQAGQKRLTESRARDRAQQRATCQHDFVLGPDDMLTCKRCYLRRTL